MNNCLRTVLWRDDESNMVEYCALKDTGQGFRFEGVMVTAREGGPLRVAYQIVCDGQGLTRSVEVDAAGGLGDHRISLAVDGQRNWYCRGRELPDCRGFSDVDLGFSPSTNSLPIRRLKLNTGESHTLGVTWVRFPEFDVVAFPQRYTRTGPHQYLFESLIDDFKAELLVDDQGIVQQYGQFWKAVVTGQKC